MFIHAIGCACARVLGLGTKVILYLTAWCCLIMFAEFPCPGVAASPDNCNPDFTKFHQTFYFICITLATVGFGVSERTSQKTDAIQA